MSTLVLQGSGVFILHNDSVEVYGQEIIVTSMATELCISTLATQHAHDTDFADSDDEAIYSCIRVSKDVQVREFIDGTLSDDEPVYTVDSTGSVNIGDIEHTLDSLPMYYKKLYLGTKFNKLYVQEGCKLSIRGYGCLCTNDLLFNFTSGCIVSSYIPLKCKYLELNIEDYTSCQLVMDLDKLYLKTEYNGCSLSGQVNVLVLETQQNVLSLDVVVKSKVIVTAKRRSHIILNTSKDCLLFADNSVNIHRIQE